MRKTYRLIAAGASAALLLAGCAKGNSASGDSGGPIRIALMSILSGPNYVKGFDNAFKLAVDEINSSGGVLGRQIEYKEFDTDITPQGAVNGTNLAIQYQPNIIIGYGVSAGLKASIGAINSAGIPVIQGTLAQLTSPASLNSKLTFRLEPTTYQFATAADKFLFGDKGVKSMMVINTQDSAPTEGAGYIADDAKKANVPTDHRAVSPTVTDLTEPILASKGKDAIWEWGYATTDALAVKTAANNGYAGQIMTFSIGSAARNGLIPTNLLTDKVHAVAVCAPYALDAPAATKYVAAFKAKYGAAPTDSDTSSYYDAVYLFKQAATQANSVEPSKIADELSKVDYQGVCGEEKADANHNLLHSVPVLSFPGGQPKLEVNETNLDSPF
jgi:branched-chain amino acid transport system substrate-binding protein